MSTPFEKTVGGWRAEVKELRAKLENGNPGCTANVPSASENANATLDEILAELDTLRAMESGHASQKSVENRGHAVAAAYGIQMEANNPFPQKPAVSLKGAAPTVKDRITHEIANLEAATAKCSGVSLKAVQTKLKTARENLAALNAGTQGNK